MSQPSSEVAIVGGGIAALSAAYELTRPEHRGRFEVTIYQRGWRLGGKGASGRGVDGRIEEHGLHLFLGYYENAFQLLRDCYAELDRDPQACRIVDCHDAFSPDPVVTLADDSPSGAWKWWTAFFPTWDELPGEPGEAPRRFTITGYLLRAVELVDTLLRSARDSEAIGRESPFDQPGNPMQSRHVEAEIQRFARLGQLASLGALLEGLSLLRCALDHLPQLAVEPLLRLLDILSRSVSSALEKWVQDSDEMRRLWVVIDLVLTFIRGVIRFDIATDPRGFDAIDDYDAREWLALAGASPITLQSTLIRSLYNLGFAYREGDTADPGMSAGQFLRGTLRLFLTYRGSLFWKMNAGMGEVVFAPIYEVLERRGVRFRFFHRLENVGIAADPDGSTYVESLKFDLQAEVSGGRQYAPLIDIDGLPCWPSEPLWEQLEDGDRLRREGRNFESFWDARAVDERRLEVGSDFDFVVLGVGLGAIPHVAKELVDRDPRWREMVNQVGTVATQAFQLWLRPELGELGWPGPRTNLTGFVEPFDTWANMDQLIEEEWWGEHEPGSIAYFCGVLPTPGGVPGRSETDYPDAEDRAVRKRVVEFLERNVVDLWPEAAGWPGGFRWELLAHPPSGVPGSEPLDSQYWRANVDPSDRYVLSLPGTQRFRISPLDNSYDNLTLAGDWTECGHNQGCVESAVISGRLAAHALSSWPRLEDIVGYDHP
ncbi:MAG: FAD-dependent oxidoreductase [Acidobacteriota bacterium]